MLCGQKQLIFSTLFWQQTWFSITCNPLQFMYSVRGKKCLIYHDDIFILPLSPPRAVTISWSSCSRRSSTWLVWLPWWLPSSWWLSDCIFYTAVVWNSAQHGQHFPETPVFVFLSAVIRDAGAWIETYWIKLFCLFFPFRSLRWSSPWCSVVGSETVLEYTRNHQSASAYNETILLFVSMHQLLFPMIIT